MAMQPFNSVPGFSVGKGTTTVITGNGDVAAGNLTVARIANLGNISNVIITGGQSGQVISTDGLGNLTFVAPSTSQLSNGNSNVQVLSNGDITFSSAGNANVVVISGSGATIATTLVAGNIYANAGIVSALTLKGDGGNISNVQGANVGGQVSNALVAGTVYEAAQPNITSVGTLSSLSITGNASVTGNVSAGNASVTGNVAGGNLTTGGLILATGNITGGNITTGGVVSANGNVSGGNLNTAGGIVANSNISTLANLIVNERIYVGNNATLISLGNPIMIGSASGANFVQSVLINQNGNGSSDWVAQGNNGNDVVGWADMGFTGATFNDPSYTITGNNDGYFFVQAVNGVGLGGNLVLATGDQGANNDIVFATGGFLAANEKMRFVDAQGSFKIKTTTAATNTTTGALVVSGGIGVAGNVYGNGLISTTSNVTGANLTTGGVVAATGNVSGGNITTGGKVTAVGNVEAAYFIGNGSQLTGIDATAIQNGTANVRTFNNGNVTVSASGNANILVVTGTGSNIAGTLNVTGNANVGNLGTSGLVVATGNVSGGNLTTSGVVSATGNVSGGNLTTSGLVSATGNVSGGNLITTGFAQASNGLRSTGVFSGPAGNGVVVDYDSANSTARISTNSSDGFKFYNTGVGNVNLISISSSGGIVANADITANGNLVSNVLNSDSGDLNLYAQGANSSINLNATGSGVISAGNTRLVNLSTPSALSDAATKAYVDNAVSTGIHIHTPVVVETQANLTATYAQGGTTPTVNTITSSSILTTSAIHNLSVNDQITFSSTTNGITAGFAYFVYSIPASNQITLAASFSGSQITTLTDGTGLTINSRANPGVGAKLTNSGAQAALVVDGVSMVLNDRVLVNNQTDASRHGVYVVSVVGSGSTNWELTRSTDQNKFSPQDTNGMSNGDYFFTQQGSVAAGQSHVLTTPGSIIIGTTLLTYTLFSDSGAYIAGTGISLDGLVINIANTTVTSGSYGNGDRVATFTVNDQGQLTAASNAAITANAANLTGTVLNSTIVNSSLTSVGALGTLSVTGNANVGNLGTSGLVVATGNVTGGNLLTGGTLSVTGNANTGNLGTTTAIITTGNITTVNTGLMQNGNSNIAIVANGNVTISAVGGARITATSAGANVTGTLGVSGNANVGNIGGAAGVFTTVAGSLTTAAQPNITSLGTLTSVAVTGNANVGNLNATANVIAPQLISNISTGTAPLVVTSTTQVANLHVAQAGVAGTVTSASQPNITGVGTLSTLNVSGNANVGNIGGAAGVFTTVAGSLTTPAQPNITSVGTLASLAVTGNITSGNFVGIFANGNSTVSIPAANGNIELNSGGAATPELTITTTGVNVAGTLQVSGVSNLGPVGNVVITGGSSGQYLQTNGSGGLSWQTVSGGGGGGSSISNGTSNVSIFSSGGEVTTSVNGNSNILVVTGTGANVAGTLNATGNANVGNLGTTQVLATANVTAPQLISNIATGTAPLVVTSTTTVANLNAAAATTAGTVTTNAQPNITSVGTLTSLGVNGTVTAVAFTANTGIFTGNGAGLSQLAGANVTGTVPSATSATNASALLQNTSTSTAVYPTFSTSSANGNSSAVINTAISANLGNASITATTFVGALSGAATTAGTVTTAAQPNITSVGTLTSLNVSGAIIGTATSAAIEWGNPSAVNTPFIDFHSSGNAVRDYDVRMIASGGNVGGSDGTGTLTINAATFAVGNALTVGTTLNATGNANVGNLGTARILATANVTAPQLISNIAIGTAPFVVTSTTQVANLNVATSGSVANGNSNVNIPAANGNVNISAVGNTTLVITGTGANVSGTLQVSGVSNLGPVGNVVITGGSSGQYLQTNGAGGLSWQTVSGGGGASISNGTSNVNIATSDGNVTTSVNGNANIFVVTGTGANVAGTFQVSGISTLGPNSNVKITGGTSGQVLGTDGTGNLSWVSPSAPPAQSVVTVTGNTTMTTSTGVYFANGLLTLTLPQASGNAGVTFYVKNINNQYVTVTGINSIDGDSSMVLRYRNSAITLISDGANWYIF